MGVIQNSLNSMLATVMGGVIGMKHIQGQQKQLEASEMAEIPKLLNEVGRLDFEESKDIEVLEGYQKDIEQYGKGKMKTYLPNDTENPIWVDRGANMEEWSNQYQMSLRGLRQASTEMTSKQMQKQLSKQRFDELYEKYYGGNK